MKGPIPCTSTRSGCSRFPLYEALRPNRHPAGQQIKGNKSRLQPTWISRQDHVCLAARLRLIERQASSSCFLSSAFISFSFRPRAASITVESESYGVGVECHHHQTLALGGACLAAAICLSLEIRFRAASTSHGKSSRITRKGFDDGSCRRGNDTQDLRKRKGWGCGQDSSWSDAFSRYHRLPFSQSGACYTPVEIRRQCLNCKRPLHHRSPCGLLRLNIQGTIEASVPYPSPPANIRPFESEKRNHPFQD
jgi:hypothetical protein